MAKAAGTMLPCFTGGACQERCMSLGLRTQYVAPSIYGQPEPGQPGHSSPTSPTPRGRMNPSASSHPEERLLKPWLQCPDATSLALTLVEDA
eukprot:Skav215944  [mRNA]  locus=scaffold226:689326:689601:+ [translate_table: standard]